MKYTVWATSNIASKPRTERVLYEGTSLASAEKAYAKAKTNTKLKNVYMEVGNRTTKYYPDKYRQKIKKKG